MEVLSINQRSDAAEKRKSFSVIELMCSKVLSEAYVKKKMNMTLHHKILSQDLILSTRKSFINSYISLTIK